MSVWEPFAATLLGPADAGQVNFAFARELRPLEPQSCKQLVYIVAPFPVHQGTKGETLKGTLGVIQGLYETM